MTVSAQQSTLILLVVNKMTDKIKGIPEGWKAKEYKLLEEGDYIPIPNKDKFVPSRITRDYILNNFSAVHGLAIECDIKTIDMSQCKVDVEYQDVNGRGELKWFAASCDDKLTGNPKIRVRENHLRGWHGWEGCDNVDCPLPEGLDITIFFRNRQQHRCSDYAECYTWETDLSICDIVGFIVHGTAEGYAYQHQMEGES